MGSQDAIRITPKTTRFRFANSPDESGNIPHMEYFFGSVSSRVISAFD